MTNLLRAALQPRIVRPVLFAIAGATLLCAAAVLGMSLARSEIVVAPPMVFVPQPQVTVSPAPVVMPPTPVVVEPLAPAPPPQGSEGRRLLHERRILHGDQAVQLHHVGEPHARKRLLHLLRAHALRRQRRAHGAR